MRCTFRYLLSILFSQLILINTAVAVHHPIGDDKVYTFGVVPQFEQRKLFRIWQPILTEIEERTGLRLKIKGSPKIPSFETSFLAGEFDFAYMNPYHITLANESQGYIPLVRDGQRSLQGILVVQKDSDITEISQLRNRKIAFPAPNALGASLIMRADLAERFNIDIRPTFVQTHSSVYLHVVKGLADAGGGVLRTLQSQKPQIQDRLRIIYKTREIPPHPVAVHPRVPKEHRDLILNAMLGIAETEQGKLMLANIPMRQIKTTNIDDYKILREWKLEKFYMTTNE